MKSIVQTLCELDRIPVAPELRSWEIDETEADAKLEALSMEFAEETTAEMVDDGDCVTCSAEKGNLVGRTILLYPGRKIPGAEEAEATLLGKKVGEKISTSISGSETVLVVTNILRHQPAIVNDTLIKKLGIEGIYSVSDYRAHILAEQEHTKRSNASRSISVTLLQGLIELSTYDIDQNEMDCWTKEQASQLFQELLDAGEDPRLPEEGFEILTDEQAIDKLAKEMESNFKQLLISRAICKQKGICISQEEIQSQIKQLRDAGLKEQIDEEKLVDGMYMSKLWGILNNYAESVLEV